MEIMSSRTLFTLIILCSLCYKTKAITSGVQLPDVFQVNNVMIPAIFGDTVNYLFDIDLQTTFTLICPEYTQNHAYVDATIGGELGEEFIPILGALFVDEVINVIDRTPSNGSLTVVPFPGTLITYRCSGEGSYSITIIAGANPFILVTPARQVVSFGADVNFNINVFGAYTTDGVNVSIPSADDYSIITGSARELTVNETLELSRLGFILVLNISDLTGTDLTIELVADESAVPSTVQVIIQKFLVPEPLLPIPISTGEQYLFDCTTSDAHIDGSTGVSFDTIRNGDLLSLDFEGSILTVTESGTYICTAFEGQAEKQVNVIVDPADSAVVLDMNFNPLPNERILDGDDEVASEEFRVICYDGDGVGSMRWLPDQASSSSLIDWFETIAGLEGNHTLNDSGIFYVVTNSRLVSSTFIDLTILNITFIVDPTGYANRFSCGHVLQSSNLQYITVTNNDPYLFLPPPTDIDASLGQSLNITFYLSSSSQDACNAIMTLSDADTLSEVPGAPDIAIEGQMCEVVTLMLLLVDNSTQNYNLEVGFIDSPDADSVAFSIFVDIPYISYSTPSPHTVKEGESIELLCEPSDPLVQLVWDIALTIDIEVPDFEPSPPFNHRLFIENATVYEQGNYTCHVRENDDIAVEIEVIVQRRCGLSYALGVMWPITFSGDTETVRCNAIDSRFSAFVEASRTCIDGTWLPVDMNKCTLRSIDTPPFIFIWFSYILNDNTPFNDAAIATAIQDLSSIIAMLGRVNSSVPIQVDTSTATLIPHESTFTIQEIDREELTVQPVLFTASLNLSSPQDIDLAILRDFFSFFGEGFFPIGNFMVISGVGAEGVDGYYPSVECECSRFAEGEGPGRGLPVRDGGRRRRQVEADGFSFPLGPLCTNSVLAPCECTLPDSFYSLPNCQCVNSFLGDGTRCVSDRDGDGFPDVALSTCFELTPADGEVLPDYCSADTCPTIFNLPQSDLLCSSTSVGDMGPALCQLETDMFGFEWGYTPSGTTRTQPCGMNYEGDASRTCGANGRWEDTNVLCIGTAFQLVMMSSALLSPDVAPTYSLDTAESVLEDLNGLVDATENDDEFSLLPSELAATSTLLRNTVDYLLLGVADENNALPPRGESMAVFEVLNNVVDLRNLPGSAQVTDVNLGEDLLSTAEGYGVYISSLLEQSDAVVNGTVEEILIAENIVLNAMSVLVEDQINDIVFPPDNKLVNTTLGSILNRLDEASITIPVSVLTQRARRRNTGRVRVSNLLFQNVEQFLPAAVNTGGDVIPATIVLCSQVEEQRVEEELADPVSLTFIALNQSVNQTFTCAFFDLDLNTFSDEGVTTVSVDAVDGNDTVITCTSTHLTSFAVLVNVGGVEVNTLALSVLSYIGLIISLICLLATIIFFLTFGKALLTAVHNFVHLNLAIALFLAYFCFALGVELAAGNKISCTVVTALLHYLFLAVFCWMLCEGVMLYLMLWVVFSTLSKKWWFFLMLGWLPPIVFVVIGLATVHDEYGVYDDTALVYCWLSSGNGTHAIWTFVAPMIAIMLINVVFLVLVMISLIRSQLKKQRVKDDSGKKRELVIATIKASFILLPLLGLTWVFGLLIVNENALVFAYIFVILNTLQGVLLFFFHVLRHERIWGRFKKKYNILQSTKPTNSQGTKSKSTASVSLVEKNAAIPLSFHRSVEDGSTEFLNKEEEDRSDTKSQDSFGKERRKREREGYETKSQEVEVSLDEEEMSLQEVSVEFND